MTKEERRNLPDPRDGFIDVEGHPKLTARYGQVKYKTPDHGPFMVYRQMKRGKRRKRKQMLFLFETP
jgi:hypothetical protein